MKQLIINPENPNGILVDMTAEEIAQRETEIANETAKLEAEATAKAQTDADAKSGNDKLIALGLSQDEVTAMTGYTIPVISDEEPE
tara:strand:- start:84 stop:341 length:258 start_codon:yes stop_codon:yes gene_type:complete